MIEYPIRHIFQTSYNRFLASGAPLPSFDQNKAAQAICDCKTGKLGFSSNTCPDCGYLDIHNRSCRNRNCPNCQAVKKALWVDARSAEVIDAPYYHVVFTLPHELNSLIYCNQSLLYGLLHKCSAETLLELSASPKYLGATPGIIQVLHTWSQELKYHVHMHCIISGGGLTKDRKLKCKSSSSSFFIPVHVLRDKFKGKFLSCLNSLYMDCLLRFSESCEGIADAESWKKFRNELYEKDWCPYIKETFNGYGNAIEYLGKYTHKIAISNARITSVTDTEVSFSARGKKPGDPRRTITLSHEEFIRRYLMHVLPSGFQKIRYYGFLNNRMKAKNLKLIFKLQGRQRFKAKYTGMKPMEYLKAAMNIDPSRCPLCGGKMCPTNSLAVGSG